MDAPNRKIAKLYEQGLAYEAAGDSYLAIKLFKKIIRLDKYWPPSYARLGTIYKIRAEWKPALYYCKKTLALDPAQANIWWALGIAATALKKRGIAKSVWSKFGLDNFKPNGPICIRLSYQKQIEILWVRPLDPARGEIINIPHPNSDRRFRDIIIYDREVVGHNVVGRRRMPIMEELSLFKRSGFRTFSCSLYTQNEKHLQYLERLCLEHGLGFEVWSNATQQLVPVTEQATPEYFSREMFPNKEGKGCIVAFGAYEMVDVQTVLESWRLVSLQRYGAVQRY